MRGEVRYVQPVLDPHALEHHVEAIGGVGFAVLGDEHEVCRVLGSHLRITTLDMLLEPPIDLDDAAFPGLFLVDDEGVSGKEFVPSKPQDVADAETEVDAAADKEREGEVPVIVQAGHQVVCLVPLQGLGGRVGTFDGHSWWFCGEPSQGQPPGLNLRKDRYEVFPAEGTETALFHIPVAGAAPGLRAFASAVDVLAAEGRVESAERLTDRAVFLGVDEAATGSGTHLPFCLLYEKGFGGSHQGGAGLGGDGGDVACYKSVVGGGDDGGHILVCLRVELLSLFYITKL